MSGGQRLNIERASPASAVTRIADALRTMSLDSPDRGFLGSEEILSAQFGVSAPTLRQAARLLEFEQVLEVRRGVAGGYYARRPRLDAITHVAGTYLRGNPAALDDIMAVTEGLAPVVVKLIVESDRDDVLAAFEEFAAPRRGPSEPDGEEARFLKLLIDATENVALRLVLSIFYDYGAQLPASVRGPDTQTQAQIRYARTALARALIAKDVGSAVAHLVDHQRLIARHIAHRLGAPAHQKLSNVGC